MDQIIEKMKAQIRDANDGAVLDILYACYMNTDRTEQEKIDRYYHQVEQYIQTLAFDEVIK